MPKNPPTFPSPEIIARVYAQFTQSQDLRSAVVFLDGKTKVKLTKVFKNEKNFKLTIGKLNYLEKKYLKKNYQTLACGVNGDIITKIFKKK